MGCNKPQASLFAALLFLPSPAKLVHLLMLTALDILLAMSFWSCPCCPENENSRSKLHSGSTDKLLTMESFLMLEQSSVVRDITACCSTSAHFFFRSVWENARIECKICFCSGGKSFSRWSKLVASSLHVKDFNNLKLYFSFKRLQEHLL